jgi:anti-sigma factor RsiW
MRCPIEVGNEAETMVAFATGRLTPAEQGAFELHMAECAECRRLADAQKSVWSALDAWRVPSVSEDFDHRLQARIAADERRPWWQRQWDSLSHPGLWFSWKPVLPVAAACVLLLGVFLLHNPIAVNGVPANPPAAVQTHDAQKVDVDQVERALDDIDMLNQLDVPASVPHAPAGS